MAAFKFLKDITHTFEEQLTCSICTEIFTDPKTLPCLHSFCTHCIVQWYEASENQDDNRMECPTCKTTIVLPYGDPSKLPPSLYFDSLLKLFHAMKSKADQPQHGCINCEQPQDLVAFCAQCDGLICEDCIKAHKTIKQIRREHQAVMLNQFKEENVNDFIKNQMMCKFHDKMKLEYYCQTCAVCICQKCATLDHENHRKQSLEDAGHESRKIIIEAMNRVEQSKENESQELEKSKENIKRIKREIDEAGKNVDDVVKMICDIAQEHGRVMKDELKKTLQELTAENEEEQTAIKTRLEESDEFVQHCLAMLGRDVAYEEIESKEMIQERAKSVSQAHSRFFSQRIKRDVAIRYSVKDQVMQSLQNIGKVVKNGTKNWFS